MKPRQKDYPAIKANELIICAIKERGIKRYITWGTPSIHAEGDAKAILTKSNERVIHEQFVYNRCCHIENQSQIRKMIKKFLSLTLLALSLVSLSSVAQSIPTGNHGCSKTECKGANNKTESGRTLAFNTEYMCEEVYNLSSQINIRNDKAQFHKIFTSDNGSVVLVALKTNQEIGTHTAPENVMVSVLEGDIEFTTPDKVNRIKSGEFMLLRADVAHSLKALKDSKIILVKIRP